MAAARRKPAPEEEGGRERWLLTYADLITLLLAFFIIMFAISSPDVARFLLLRGSLTAAFNQGVLEGTDTTSVISAGQFSLEGEIPDLSNPAASQVQAQVQALQDQKAAFQDAVAFTGQRQEGFTIAVANTMLFTSGSAELTPEGTAALSQLADILRPINRDLRIEGHTDSITPGSTRFPTNWELSAARAVTITHFFETVGIPPYRLSAFGYGEQRPIASNDTAEGRAQNRRSEIVLIQPGTSLLPPLGEESSPPGVR